nr:hypothetical protein GCM10020092_002840 [Actinoplanes digitatis]
MLDRLPPHETARIAASVEDARIVAARVLVDLRGIENELADAVPPPKLVGTEHSCKTWESLGRAYLEQVETEGSDLDEFLAGAKDRVRFSFQISDAEYTATVQAIFDALRGLGYRPGRMVNFWQGGG